MDSIQKFLNEYDIALKSPLEIIMINENEGYFDTSIKRFYFTKNIINNICELNFTYNNIVENMNINNASLYITLTTLYENILSSNVDGLIVSFYYTKNTLFINLLKKYKNYILFKKFKYKYNIFLITKNFNNIENIMDNYIEKYIIPAPNPTYREVIDELCI